MLHINCLISYRAGAWHHRIFPDFLKSPVSKWRIVGVKTRTKAFLFEEILINIPSENLSKLTKERMQYFCHAVMPWSKTEGADTQQVHEQLFDEQVARTKHDYKFSTAKDPVFNSTRIWKVEDHCRKEHRCDCARTDRSPGMLEQNLKGQYRRTYLDYSRRGKD